MEKKIIAKIDNALVRLDHVADTFGAARASHIALLAGDLMEIRKMAGTLAAENKRLTEKLPQDEKPFESEKGGT